MDAKTARAKIIESAGRQMEEEGRVTYQELVERTRLGYMSLKSTVHRMRRGGAFPWEIAPAPARGRGGWSKPREGTTRPANNDERFRADDGIRLAIDAELMRPMIDARAEVDDPREHGRLAVPRSLPRAEAGEGLREVCAAYVRHWRAVRRRQRRRWQPTRKAAA